MAHVVCLNETLEQHIHIHFEIIVLTAKASNEIVCLNLSWYEVIDEDKDMQTFQIWYHRKYCDRKKAGKDFGWYVLFLSYWLLL